jgi:hypothetical protein
MKLSTAFTQMEMSELNQLSCVDQGTGKIMPTKYQAIVEVMNAGLVDLHTRFKLKVGTVTVPIEADKEVYNLADYGTQVNGRFLQLHSVQDEHSREIAVNDFTDRSVNFLNRLTMVVPPVLRRDYPVKNLVVKYRSLGSRIMDCYGDIDPEITEIDLDMPYLWALCLYTASRLHMPVGLQDGTQALNAYFGLYNAECARLTDAGLDLGYVEQQTNAIRRAGWA